jgi:uncharacterized protein involved in type VI secretion and phage assembly
MIGVASGIVIDNEDPDGLHRVKVEFPVIADIAPKTSWCRVTSPMAGKDRGWVLLPDVGTEVLVGYVGMSATPVVLGGLFNGKDDKIPYDNADGKNNLRLIWTNADHQMVFDDSSGAESIGIGAKASKVGDVTSGVVHQLMDDSKKKFIQKSDGDIEMEAKGTLKITCMDFEVSAKGAITIEATKTSKLAGASTTIEGKAKVAVTAAQVTLG